MKLYSLIPLLSVSYLLAGCAVVRPVTDMAAGAGGGVIASELSHGNPGITAAGAAGGVLLSEGGFYLAGLQATNAYIAGYDKGRSDAVKQQYWILVNQQHQQNGSLNNVSLYAIPVPEQTLDGVILNPTTKYLRVEN
jgi:hypothetical protein